MGLASFRRGLKQRLGRGLSPQAQAWLHPRILTINFVNPVHNQRLYNYNTSAATKHIISTSYRIQTLCYYSYTMADQVLYSQKTVQ